MAKQKKVPEQIKVDLPAEGQAQKQERTISDIQNQYSVTCAKAGQLQYQIHTLNKELGLINEQLRDLNLEAAVVKAKQDQQSSLEAK